MPQGPIPPTPLTLFQLRLRGGLPTATGKVPAPTPLYTEFYCVSGGSNLNSGTDENTSAFYTSTNGNWDATTRIFTPTDGSNPATAGVAVGQYVSIYLDGASVGVFIARVTNVVNAANGAVTVHATAQAGSAPSTGATGRTLKAGGAWSGMSGSSAFPFNTYSFTALTDVAGNLPRVNLKNNQTYSVSATISVTGSGLTIQGYSSNRGDGGRVTITSSLTGSTGSGMLHLNNSSMFLIDAILVSTGASGSLDGLVVSTGSINTTIRVTVKDVRGNGINFGNTACRAIECEVYNCNLSNTSGAGGFKTSSTCQFTRCIAANNPGVNTDGFASLSGASNVRFSNCISFGNGRHGYSISTASGNLNDFFCCDAYNNAGDGIRNLDTVDTSTIYAESCNFLRNGGAGISGVSLTTGKWYGQIINCGFGNGTMANRGGKTVAIGNVRESGRIEYPVDVTPWADPDVTGNFSIALLEALGAGRGFFTQTQGGYSGTVGYPDIGAAQHSDSVLIGWDDANTIEPYAYVNYVYTTDWTFAVPVTMTLFSGSLPPGLSLVNVSPTEYKITGTPTGVVGVTYSFVLRLIQNSIHQDATFSITVQDDPDQGSAFAGGF